MSFLRGTLQNGWILLKKNQSSLKQPTNHPVCFGYPIWVWVKNKPPGFGPQVKSSLVPFTRASHFGVNRFLSHSHRESSRLLDRKDWTVCAVPGPRGVGLHGSSHVSRCKEWLQTKNRMFCYIMLCYVMLCIMHVCMYVCMYVCICVCVCVFVYIYIYM